MAKPETNCVACSKCGEAILICVGTTLADEFSVKCAACLLRGFYRQHQVTTASAYAPDRASPSLSRRSHREFGAARRVSHAS